MAQFLSLIALHEFVKESTEEIKLSESLLDFELRESTPLHFCGWCGLGVHYQGGCVRGD